MKPASAALKSYLATARQINFADTYTFTFLDTSTAYYTNAQIRVLGVPPFDAIVRTYEPNQVVISGMKFKLGLGVGVDEQDVTIGYRDDMLIQGVPWRVAFLRGVFDGCRIHRDRFF